MSPPQEACAAVDQLNELSRLVCIDLGCQQQTSSLNNSRMLGCKPGQHIAESVLNLHGRIEKADAHDLLAQHEPSWCVVELQCVCMQCLVGNS